MKTISTANEIEGIEAIVALGMFDGVHSGHQALFREALGIRDQTGLPVLALTFHPHPRTVIGGPNGYHTLLTPKEEKIMLLEELGIDLYWSIPFTRELAYMGPEDFARRYLTQHLSAKYVVCGFDFTFGRKGSGKPEHLEAWQDDLGFRVRVVEPYVVDGQAVSSTRIRKDLAQGKVEDARALLGRPYCLSGKVSHGHGCGRKIGFPTSNIEVPCEKLLPAGGVYAAAVRVMLLEEARPAVVNIGTRPTFGGTKIQVEIHIPGFSGDLYGRNMHAFLTHRLRDERKFPDVATLQAQISKDLCSARDKWHEAAWPHSFTLIRAYDRMLAQELP